VTALLLGWFDVSLIDWTRRLVYAAAVGQTLFVVLWATLPFYRTWVGRALMIKSLSLMIYLDWAVAVINGWVPESHRQNIAVVLFGLITVGIWSQLVAILVEMMRGRRLLSTDPPTLSESEHP
jgi:hypothetical protein